MHPTQGRPTHLQWEGSRSPVTRTRPPVLPVKSHPARIVATVSAYLVGNVCIEKKIATVINITCYSKQ